MRTRMFAALIAFTALATSGRPAPGRRYTRHLQAESAASFTGWPQITIWAWQRPNNLSFIDPRRVGVSYLIETIHVGRTGVVVARNANPLAVPANAWLIACARIEMEPDYAPAPPLPEARNMARLLSSLAQFPEVKAVQIDFDATVSQRAFYRDLLTELRRRLPASMPLSITALASWCEGDDWISDLPVSEAVPMLFRMGNDRASILLRLRAGDDFAEPLCRTSAGISTDEVFPRLPPDRRLYIFNPAGWTSAALRRIERDADR